MSKMRLLLHICCGPCVAGVIEELQKEYEVIPYFYNPNIWPEDEYNKRLEATQKALVRILENAHSGEERILELITGKYDPEKWDEAVKGLEAEPEGGARCEVCFRFRLENAVQKAEELGIENLATTLSISPHKNAAIINKVGREITEAFNRSHCEAEGRGNLEIASSQAPRNDPSTTLGAGKLIFLEKDFSAFYHKSCEESKKAGLYRQNYCGCRYSAKCKA